MRHIARALVGIVLIATNSQNLAAAETTSHWWQFGHKNETKVSQPPSLAPSASPQQMPYPGGALSQPTRPSSAPLARQSQLPSNSADKEHWMLSSPKGKVGWPHLAKPHLPTTGIFAHKPNADPTRNSWVEKTPTPPKPSPMKPITDGAHKVAKSTKAAWHKTVDALTPGEPAPAPRNSSSRIAKRDAQPSFWKRMFGSEQEPQGSQTMPEFMAQQRVDASPTQTR